MKCLFVHDHTGHIFGDKVYTEHFSYEMWSERYLPIFENINVLCKTTEDKQDPSSKMVLSIGKGVKYLCRINSFNGPFVFFNSKIKHIIREEVSNNDAVILRLDSFLGLMAAKECERQNKPYLIEVAGCAWDSFWNHGLSGKIIAPYIFIKTRSAIRKAPFVVYVTSKFLQHRYPNNKANTNCSNVFLPDNIDEANILNNRLSRINETIARNNNKIIIGTTAHYDVKYKGQQYVIRALAELKKRGINCFTYELVGNGKGGFLKQLAEQLGVRDRVIFKGALPHAKVLEWLDTIDIYIQPSKQEGLPRSVIEAMSRGVPSFGAKTAGIPELIPENYLFSNSKNNYKEIASLLEENISMEKFSSYAENEIIEARKYQKAVIEERRKKIFQQLKSATVKQIKGDN